MSRASSLTRKASPQPPSPRPLLIFYGGKGGVGKTTCAAAFALSKRPARVLVVSTDPAHSLGDALDVKLSSTPRQIRRGLDAVELDAPRALARWLRDHRRALGDILEHGTWLDSSDVDALLDLSFPGVDELVGLMEIERLASAKPYDFIVVDTAPTGHTLRLLAAPETVGVVAGVLDALQAQHRLIRDRLARVAHGPEAADRLIALLASQAGDTAKRLRDRRQTSFHWVTLPEMMSVNESLDAMAALERAGIRVGEIIVNRVLPPARPCPLCDRRREEEHRVLAVIRRRLGQRRTVRTIPAELKEPRGLPALARIGRRLVTTPLASELSTTEDAEDTEVKSDKGSTSASTGSSVVESSVRKAAPEAAEEREPVSGTAVGAVGTNRSYDSRRRD